MIDRINNNIPADYSVPQNKAVKVGSNEHFSLESAIDGKPTPQEEDGVIYEPTEKKSSKTTTGSSNNKDSFENSLVKAQTKQKEEERIKQVTDQAYKEIWESVKNFFTGLWKNIRRIFGNVWDSKPIGEGVDVLGKSSETSDDILITEATNISESNDEIIESNNEIINTNPDSSSSTFSGIEELEAARDSQIKQALEDGDRDAFRDLITDNGKLQPARNSSMLTTYNAKGKIVDINPSDENKILHGNRGTRKL